MGNRDKSCLPDVGTIPRSSSGHLRVHLATNETLKPVAVAVQIKVLASSVWSLFNARSNISYISYRRCYFLPHYSSLTAAMIESQSRSVVAVDHATCYQLECAAVSSQSDRQVAALPDLLRCLPDEFWACSCYWMLLVLNREMIQSIYYIYIYISIYLYI